MLPDTVMPGPCLAEVSKKWNGYRKSMAGRKGFAMQKLKCWSCEVHQRMSKWLLRCQRMKESMHKSRNEHKGFNESVGPWINKSMTQLVPESMNQGANGLTVQ